MPSVIFGNRIRSFQPESLPPCESRGDNPVETANRNPAALVPQRRDKSIPVLHDDVLGLKYSEFKHLPAEMWNGLESCIRDTLRQLSRVVSEAYDKGMEKELARLLDETIPQAVQGLGREVIECLLRKERGFFGSKIHCADCDETAEYQGDPHLYIMTKLGKVSVWRAYYACPNGHYFYPLDIQLGVDGKHRQLPSVQEEISLLTSRMPYAEAVDTLTRLTPIKMSVETAERVTHTIAGGLQERQDRERQDAFGDPASATLPEPIMPVAPGEVAVVAADGGMCKIRNDEECREFKVGVLGTVAPLHDPNVRPKVESKHYIGHMTPLHPVDDFFQYLAVEYRRRGLHLCKMLHVVADGADCFWTRFGSLKEAHQELSECLDFYHSGEHIGDLASVLFDTAGHEREAWFQQMRTYLWESQLNEFFHQLGHQYAAAVGSGDQIRADAIRAGANYFHERRRLLRYKECREQGLPIGSGMVEGGIRFVGKDRLDRTGMKWLVEGAEAVLQLRCLDASGRWGEYFSTSGITRLEGYKRKKAAWLRAA